MLDLTFLELQNNLRVSFNALSNVVADDNIGSANRSILEATAAQIEEILYYFDQQIAKLFLSTAEGEDLHFLAYDRYRLVPKPPKAAIGRIDVYKDMANVPPELVDQRYPIPVGTIFETEPDPITGEVVRFETTESASILLSSGTGRRQATDLSGNPHYIPVVCLEEGIQGNVPAGKITVVGSSGIELDLVTNLEPTTGGQDAQDDDSFRDDIVQYLLTLARGTSAALIFGAKKGNYVTSASVVESGPILGKPYLTFDPDTEMVYQVTFQQGNLTAGKVCVYVDDGGNEPNRDTMEKILLDIEEYRGAGTQILLASPEVKFVDVEVEVILDDEVNIEEARAEIIDAVSDYMNSLGLGGRLYRNRLTAAILNVPTVRNVTIKSPTSDETNVGQGQVLRLNRIVITQVREREQ